MNTVIPETVLYLTYIASNGSADDILEIRYEDENIWLTQKSLASLYDVEINTINYHIKKVFDDKELEELSTIRKFRIVQDEGNRKVARQIEHYNLEMIIAVGFKVNSEKAVEFRKWINKIAKDYTIKGWVLDKERLINGTSKLTDKYYEELLTEIREIRLSERRFYQKITDIYATSVDYDYTAKITKDFFATVQNKLHFAIHGNTAAEVIMSRANHKNKFMGLTSWKGFPDGKIQKYDVSIAKNYLDKEELTSLEMIVIMYLDYAEYQARRKIPMTMKDWVLKLNSFLKFNEHEILNNPSKISHEIAKAFAESEFEKYRIEQDKLYKSDFDMLLEETVIN